MTKLHFSPDQLVQVAQLSEADLAVIAGCRRPRNKLGFAYQLAFVRLFNLFPAQVPFEPLDDIVSYMSLQLDLPTGLITEYQKRQQTIAQHRQRLQEYLQLQPFHPDGVRLLAEFLYQEAMQIEPTDSLLIKAATFLRDHHHLNPAEDTLRRMIVDQRNKARTHIFKTINAQLSDSLKQRLDSLLHTGGQTLSEFFQIKDAPRIPSEAGMKRLSAKLDLIEQTGALSIDLGWLNNNYKRHLSRYALNCDAHRLRELTPKHRYASLICFLQDAYQDVIDYTFDMYAKALTSVHAQAETTVNKYNKSKRKVIRSCLRHYKKLCQKLVDVAANH